MTNRLSDADALALTDARAHLPALVDKAEHHHRSTDITRHGRLVARIVPPAEAEERDAMCTHQDQQRHCGGDERIHLGGARCCDCIDELDYWQHRHPDVAAWLDAPGSGIPRHDKVLRAAGDLAWIAMRGPYRGHPGVSLRMAQLTAALAELMDRQIAVHAHEAVRGGTPLEHLAGAAGRDPAELAARWIEWSWGQAGTWRGAESDEHAAVADAIGPGWRAMWEEGLPRYRDGRLPRPAWRDVLNSRPGKTA